MERLLFLSHRVPYPPDKGEKIRAWHILQHLARTHRIHLGCFVDDPADRQHLPLLRAICAEVACFPLTRSRGRLNTLRRLRPGQPLSAGWFHDARLAAWVEAQLRVPEMRRAFVFSSAMAPYLMHARRMFRVLDLVDVDSEKWAAYAAEAKQPMQAVWAREARTLLALERRAVAAFDHALLVSEHEWRHFAALAPDLAGRAGWMRNGVDLRWFDPALQLAPPFGIAGKHVVFTGRMDYRPNIDAVCWFAREVLPALHHRCPDARFWIVGAAPAPAVTALAALNRVHVTGRVDDTRPYIAHAMAVVAPLRIARGVQNKVLEAMAMARPVIATPAAFEGIDARPGRDLLLAETVAEMTASIAEVLEGQHPALGPAARRAVETAHQWLVALQPLDRLFAPALQEESVA